MYNIIGKKKIWFSLSGLLIGLSVMSLLIWGLNLGIDFTGGSILQISYSHQRPALDQINGALGDLSLGSLTVQPSGDKGYILRFEQIEESIHQNILSKLKDIKIDGVEDNQLLESSFEAIGPTIGSELKSKAMEAIIIVLIFIVLYIAYAFRKVSKPVASWKYGL